MATLPGEKLATLWHGESEVARLGPGDKDVATLFVPAGEYILVRSSAGSVATLSWYQPSKILETLENENY